MTRTELRLLDLLMFTVLISDFSVSTYGMYRMYHGTIKNPILFCFLAVTSLIISVYLIYYHFHYWKAGGLLRDIADWITTMN